jgi:hypothetical protein
MKQRDKRDLLYLLILLCLVLMGMLLSCDGGLKKEIEQLREELARQQQYAPLERDTIRDSVKIITQKVVEVEKVKEVLTKEDRELMKDIGMKVDELESLQKTGTETKDTVVLAAVPQQTGRDSVLAYHDAWADFEYNDKILRYAVRDSLAIAVRKEYKHRFLFWRWGTKGYEVKVANFNPHSTIRYNTFVKRRQ